LTEEQVDQGQTGEIQYTTVPVYRKKRPVGPTMRLSLSKIATFKQCCQRYKFLYVDGLGDVYGKPRPYFTMANHLHATLQDFLSIQPVTLRTSATMKKLLTKNWRRYRVGFRDNRDELRWQEKALTQLEGFVSNHDVSKQPLVMEELMEAEVTPGLTLRGRVDRIDREPDDSLHVIDYKTGKLPQEIDWAQLELHALIASKHFTWPVRKVSYLYLSQSLMRSTQISPGELRRVQWDVMAVAKRIARERRFHPSVGIWCRNCDFISICPSKTDAEQVALANGQLELWDEPGGNQGDNF